MEIKISKYDRSILVDFARLSKAFAIARLDKGGRLPREATKLIVDHRETIDEVARRNPRA